jgi:hypothetical protein
MKVSRGSVHKYLDMTLDFSSKHVVKVSMCEYVDEIIKAWDKACLKFDDGFTVVKSQTKIKTAAPDDLFKIDEEAVKLEPAASKCFHNIVAKTLYVTKRAKPDTAVAVAFLTTRVREPDVDDWRKLRHLVEYLCSTRNLPLVLGANNTGVLSWYVDASFAVHPNMRGHTGRELTMGTGFPLVSSTKQKLNTRSLTESELVGVDDVFPQILWARLFLKAQGFKVVDNVIHQDNKSTILLERNGRASSSKRTNHIKIWYYVVTDRISKRDVSIEWCHTSQMVADFLTKPLHGKVFCMF